MTNFLAFVGLVAILGAIAAAIFFFGGFYNVAGTATDPEVVKWALSHVRDASIERHAQDTPPLSLDDPTIVQAGAPKQARGRIADEQLSIAAVHAQHLDRLVTSDCDVAIAGVLAGLAGSKAGAVRAWRHPRVSGVMCIIRCCSTGSPCGG